MITPDQDPAERAVGSPTGSRARGSRGGFVSTRRAEILQVAGRCFAASGFAATTVRDVAEAAGLTSGSLYHHFRSKEEMIDEILRGFLADLVRDFELVRDSEPDPAAALGDLVRHAFQVIHDRPTDVVLFQREGVVLAQRPGFDYLGEGTEKVERVWRQVVESGQRRGVFRSDVDPKVAYRFIRDTVWASVRWYRGDGSMSPRELADQCLRVLLGGLLHESKY
ncbi:TetR/AcrR family transcriptional regulator [Nocardioides sp. zg-ZUI104]|uniref:TetR/AcrR family transcriptional regulator n=1 Tax=Nocardioides faecalis TaxID=2803858 RepID=UPI001BCCE5F8|nr:TetR/AcrR family transcriptional regulator [Nocardioides faecalis]MBS4751945.1 TetR/AcrR family transcriptional regulator [Nocardioides faecalis]